MVMGELALETQVLVIGAGPGGYAAAFRAADLGLEVTLVDTAERPGGVCLFRGCIPSKSLLHASELLHDARAAATMGIQFAAPRIDLDTLRNWKNSIIDHLADGLVSLTRQRGIAYIRGRAVFEGPDTVRLTEAEVSHVRFKHAIIATGSQPVLLGEPSQARHPRVMTSTEALELADIPADLLVVGGGYVGLELGSVYAALGSRVTLVEAGPRLLAGADQDLVRILARRLAERFSAIHLQSRIIALQPDENGVAVVLQTGTERSEHNFTKALVAVGRRSTCATLAPERAGVLLDAQGFIQIDDRQRTSNPAVFAVGDAAGGVMLAHKATYQGKVAAEVIAGQPSAFDVRAIPAIVYTDPQVAWAGMTAAEAEQQGIAIETRRFPWKISGRAASMGLEEGLTKMIVERQSRRILGVGAVGRTAEALIAEAVLAIEMGALADDIALSIHPHPTLSETQSEVAEIFLGRATHIIARPR